MLFGLYRCVKCGAVRVTRVKHKCKVNEDVKMCLHCYSLTMIRVTAEEFKASLSS